ncbi:MAG: ABC transporter permease [Armatimonadota bacterium]|nr:ABC transporter permease [Armatimonadota bacterium]MDR7551348.1 ABC transporter permease [Armatimonadota bacterium]
MTAYILGRLSAMPITLLLVTLTVFLLIFVGGDPAVVLGGDEADRATLQRIRAEFGLDRPVPVQYADWLLRVVRGDLGRSMRTNQQVSVEIGRRMVPTLQLGVLAVAISLAIAVPAGVISAVRRNTIPDYACRLLATLGISLPNFWLGILLVLGLAVLLPWLPAGGYIDPFTAPLEGLKTLLLPAVTLGMGMAGVLTRMIRSSMLDVLGEDYVRTARSKGLVESVVVLRHAMRNALIPVVTVLGLQVRTIIGGTIVIETLFALPGVGRMLVDGFFARDFPLVQGVILVIALSVVLANLVVDVAYAYLDPRIRYA